MCVISAYEKKTSYEDEEISIGDSPIDKNATT